MRTRQQVIDDLVDLADGEDDDLGRLLTEAVYWIRRVPEEVE